MKDKFTHRVSVEQMRKAEQTWAELYGYHHQYSWPSLWIFLGRHDVSDKGQEPAPDSGHRWCYRATERAYNKVQMLTSPHARTLMQAFIARTGYQKKLPSQNEEIEYGKTTHNQRR